MDAPQETDTLSSISTMSSIQQDEDVPPFGFYGQYREKYGEMMGRSTESHSSSNEDIPQRQSTPRARRRKKHHHADQVRNRPASASPPRRRTANSPLKEGPSSAHRSSSSRPRPSDLEERYWAHKRQASENITNVNQRITAARQRLISQMKRLDGCSENLKNDNSELQRLRNANEYHPKKPVEKKRHNTETWAGPRLQNAKVAFWDETNHFPQASANGQDDDSRYAALQEKISKDMKKGQKLLSDANERNSKSKHSNEKSSKSKMEPRRHSRKSASASRKTPRGVQENKPERPQRYATGVVPGISSADDSKHSHVLSQVSNVQSISILSDDTVTPKLKKLKDSVRMKTEKISWLQKELEARDKELSNIRDRNQALEQDYASAKDTQYRLQEQLSEEKASTHLLQSKLEWIQEQNSELKKERETSRQSREEIENRVEQAVKRKYEHQDEEWEKRVQEVRDRLTRYYEEQLQLLRSKQEAADTRIVEEAEKKPDDTSRSRQFLEERIQELSQKVSRLQTEKDSEYRRANQEHEKISQLHADLQDKDEEVGKLKTENNALYEQIEQKRNSLQSLQHNKLVTQQELDDSKDEIRRLQEINKNCVRKKEVDGIFRGLCYSLRQLQKDMESFFELSSRHLTSLESKQRENTSQVTKCQKSIHMWKERVQWKTEKKFEEGKSVYKRKLDNVLEQEQHQQKLFQDEIESYKNTLSELRSSESAAQREKEACKREMESLRYEKSNNDNQLQHYKEENGELRKTLQQKEAELERESSTVREKSQRISMLEEQIQNESDRADRLQTELSTTRTSLAEEKNSRHSLENDIEYLRSQMEELQSQLASSQRSADQAREASRRSQEELADALRGHQEEVNSLMEVINSQRRELTKLRSGVEAENGEEQHQRTHSMSPTFLTSEEGMTPGRSAKTFSRESTAPSLGRETIKEDTAGISEEGKDARKITAEVVAEEDEKKEDQSSSLAAPVQLQQRGITEEPVRPTETITATSVSKEGYHSGVESSNSCSHQAEMTSAAATITKTSHREYVHQEASQSSKREAPLARDVTATESHLDTDSKGENDQSTTTTRAVSNTTQTTRQDNETKNLSSEEQSASNLTSASRIITNATTEAADGVADEEDDEGSDWDEDSSGDKSEHVTTVAEKTPSKNTENESFYFSEESDWDTPNEEQVSHSDRYVYDAAASSENETPPKHVSSGENETSSEEAKDSGNTSFDGAPVEHTSVPTRVSQLEPTFSTDSATMLGLKEDDTTSSVNRSARNLTSTAVAEEESDSESIDSIPEIQIGSEDEQKASGERAPAFQQRRKEPAAKAGRNEAARKASQGIEGEKASSTSSKQTAHEVNYSSQETEDVHRSESKAETAASWATTIDMRQSEEGNNTGASVSTSHEQSNQTFKSNYEEAVEKIISLPAEHIENLCRLKPVSDSIAVVAGAVCILVGKKPSWKNATNFFKDEEFRTKFKNANPLDITEKNANVIKSLVDQKDLRNYRSKISEQTHNPAEVALLDWSLSLVDDVLSNKGSDSYNYLEEWKAPDESQDAEAHSRLQRSQSVGRQEDGNHSTESKPWSEKTSEQKLKAFKEKAREGVRANKFGRLWMSPRPRIITYEDSAAGERIFWKDPDSAKPSDSSIRLSDITHVAKGAESSIVDKYAKKKDRPRCLGLQTTSRDLAFQFESEEERDWFAEGLNLLLRESTRGR